MYRAARIKKNPSHKEEGWDSLLYLTKKRIPYTIVWIKKTSKKEL
jgi:hypothetical protein